MHILKEGDVSEIWGQVGYCGGRQVFIGFAQASLLTKLSFVDQLDELTGKGYQRRFHEQHSLEFKRYIHEEGASTIPLTFNLRPETSDLWSLITKGEGLPAVLRIEKSDYPVMSQVDCQHRLGFMEDSSMPFAFMSYIGLSAAEEMELFRVINGKAKGLSGSLLDYTEAKLNPNNLCAIKPELFIALKMQETPASPWYQKLDLGGRATVGMKRQASLRTMQIGIKRFLKESHFPPPQLEDSGPQILIHYWNSIRLLLPKEWEAPRKHMLTKGVGVYALMSLAGVMYRKAIETEKTPDLDFFMSTLSGFIGQIDWSNHGSLHGFGGASGADKAFDLLMLKRSTSLGAVPLYG